ncbi:mCG148255 [Mus musculus]|jgi:hypothetical protein|nr:mCG148255 [Mus musculus]
MSFTHLRALLEIQDVSSLIYLLPRSPVILMLLQKDLAQLDSMFTVLPVFFMPGIAALGCKLDRFCFIQQIKQKKTLLALCLPNDT